MQNFPWGKKNFIKAYCVGRRQKCRGSMSCVKKRHTSKNVIKIDQ